MAGLFFLVLSGLLKTAPPAKKNFWRACNKETLLKVIELVCRFVVIIVFFIYLFVIEFFICFDLQITYSVILNLWQCLWQALLLNWSVQYLLMYVVFFANILQTSWLVAKVIWSVKFLSTAQKTWHWSDWQNGRLNSSLKLLRSRRAVTTAETSWAVLKSSSTQSLVQISILRTRMIDVWVQRIWVTSFKKF